MNIWSTVLQSLKKRVSSQAYNDWLKPTYEIFHDDKLVRVKVPNERFREHIREHYSPMIHEILDKNDYKNMQVDFVADMATQLSLPQIDEKQVEKSSLNLRHSFENFVVGPFNQFAHAAAHAVANNLSKVYNPLFIYGGSGLGKTHLLNAIGIKAWELNPKIKLIYVSTEEFTNEFIKALRLPERMQAFKERYRTADLLLIDDIHQISGKASTQDEFFHTFNALYENQKQIVLASDQLPRDIPGLRERLHSRFQGGLIADIQLPDVETKVAILHKKAQMEHAVIPDDVAWFIASRVKSNIRNLEGCLIRMLAMTSFTGAPISISLAKQVLKPYINTEDRVITPNLIQETVAQYYQLKVEELKSKNNSKAIVAPRQVAMYLCKQLTACSLPEIGKSFGGKHHSTVIHSISKIQDALRHDPILQNEINTLIETIKTT